MVGHEGTSALLRHDRAFGSGVLAATAEADDFRWHRDELAAPVTPALVVRLTDALDYAGTPAIRAHDGMYVLAGLLPTPAVALHMIRDRSAALDG